MTSDGPDLARLTVPQLKALCKERRITGYSKLSKAALVQRLAGPTSLPSATVPHALAIAMETPTQSQNYLVTSVATKRPAHTDTPVPSKRTKASFNANHGPPPSISAPERLPDESSAFKVPELPVQSRRSSQANASTPAKSPSVKHVVPRQVDGATRFKPLVPSAPKCVGPGQEDRQSSRRPAILVEPTGLDSALNPNFQTTLLPVLSQISIPPRASERKWVCRWAIILSAISPADKKTCMFVSRTFRYAVYLSAAHILSRTYSGRRWSTVFDEHPRNMTNFWPYLRFRMDEVSQRRQAFNRSFLGRYTNAIGYDPLSAHLWTCPDDEKQVDLALRFVLTRMWFAASIGAYGHDASTWSKSIIQDVREVVKGEIWQVISRYAGTGKTDSFYVLEATCEVIGQPPSSSYQGEETLGYCLRVDWTAWISERSRAIPGVGRRSLLECVKWSNTEDYDRGISKVWLHRVQRQGVDSVAKRSVAERYILASVVANGISGRWMSTSAMAQEFAGLSGAHDALGSRAAGRSAHAVNMYLAAHHHIESVHFTTSDGDALHDAVAVVQTPGREYYVLRDNGMQVGCEEEGVSDVWQQIIGCDVLGRARPL